MDKNPVYFKMGRQKMRIFTLLVVQMFVLQTNAGYDSVGVTCTAGGGECNATTERCDNGKCVCTEGYINMGMATCVSTDCTAAADCDNIQNTYCNTGNKCVCNALSVISTADDMFKGACVAKACTPSGNECDGIAGAACSKTSGTIEGECVCKDNYELQKGVCTESGAETTTVSNVMLITLIFFQVSLVVFG